MHFQAIYETIMIWFEPFSFNSRKENQKLFDKGDNPLVTGQGKAFQGLTLIFKTACPNRQVEFKKP